MKRQIERFSPHQNGKVFAVPMAVGSLVFVVPFVLLASLAAPQGAGPPALLVIAFPLIYLVPGHLSVAVGCWLYNVLFELGGRRRAKWSS